MPAATEVSDDAILRAGEALIAAGRRVSAYALRTQVGHGDARRLLAVWERLTQSEKAASEPPAAPPVALPPDLAEQASAWRDRLATELDMIIASAWAAAERRASDRLRAEIAEAKAAAETALRDQRDADEALAAADATQELLIAERDAALAQLAEARACAERAMGERDGAHGERDRIATELAQVRRDHLEAERRAAAAEAVAEERAAPKASRQEAISIQDPWSLALRLGFFLGRSGLSAEDLAQRAGVPVEFVGAIFRDPHFEPDPRLLRLVATSLGVDVQQLLGFMPIDSAEADADETAPGDPPMLRNAVSHKPH